MDNEKFDSKKIDEFLSQLSNNKNIWRSAPLAGLVILGLFFLFSTFYTINPEEVGVVQRYGKYIGTTQPGLHIKFPWGIDKVTKVKTQFVYKQEFGFQTSEPGIRSTYSRVDKDDVTLMLTGDLNIADVEWSVQFKIQDPVKFLFNVRAPVQTLRDASEAAMRMVVGDRSVDEVLTVGREEVNRHAQDRLQAILDGYQTGIRIVTIELQDVNPPEAVKESFDDVNKARQEKETLINQAREAYNKVIPKARGEADKIISSAEGYASKRINEAKGDANRFSQVYQAYTESPTVTKRQLYIETMADLLSRVKTLWIVDEKLKNVVPFLQNIGATAAPVVKP